MNTRFQGNIKKGDHLTDHGSIDVEVRGIIASGGFGLIYFGPNHLSGGRWFALKTLRPDVFTHSQRAYDLFVREGLTWVGLWPHANVLLAQVVTIINDQPFLVLDFAWHASLRIMFNSARQQGRWLPPSLALLWAQQIAAGLVALHTPDPAFLRPQPLVHRDLKPENVLLDEHINAKITDFGLVKVIEEASAENAALRATVVPTASQAGDVSAILPAEAATHSRRYQTARGMALGTLAYMAPEQWTDAASASPAADVYAFGLIFGELFTGHHPLLDLDQPHSEVAWREAHQTGQPRSLASLAAQRACAAAPAPDADMLALLAEVESLYQVCLRKRAEARPTAREILTRLQQASKRLGQASYTPSEVYAHTVDHEQAWWNNLAITYENLGLHVEALERNDHALALAPADPAVLLNRGVILAALDRQEEALAAYDQSLAARPSDDDLGRKGIWINRGICLTDLGRYAEADGAYAQALAPDNAHFWYNRANNQHRWGLAEAQAGHVGTAQTRFQAGIGYAERSVTINPNNPRSQALLAELRRLVKQATAR